MATIELDDDVAEVLERLARERGVPVPDLLRDFVQRLEIVPRDRSQARSFRLRTVSLGQPLVDNIDDVSALLEEAEGPDHR